jgi:ubiquinol-cytochrome c reductase cytochrome b subunit
MGWRQEIRENGFSAGTKRWWNLLSADLSGLLARIALHPVPPGERRDWLYVFGSATLVAFLVQLVTGIALATMYVSSAAHAYDSLEYITNTAVLGNLLRGMHYWGASVMIVLVGFHAIRVYMTAAYKYPRMLTWTIGIFLLIFTMMMGFTGQTLRWDADGVYSTVIASEQLGRYPLVGRWLVTFILGGPNVSGDTLSRFFMAHVFVFPILLVLFLTFHLFLVVRHGISEWPAAGRQVDPRTYRPWYEALLREQGQPFWPDAAWRDVVVGLVVVMIIIGLAATVGPIALGKPPSLANVDVAPRPSWYFTWYFAFLAMIPYGSETYVMTIAPMLFVFLLLFLPFVFPRGERTPLRRPWSFALVIMCLATILYYWRVGLVAPWSPRFNAVPVPASVVGTTTGPVAVGAGLFYTKGCEFCHQVAGYGGIRGPDLTCVADRLSAARMMEIIFTGIKPNMPSFARTLEGNEASDLLAFLKSRKCGQAAPPGK